MLSDPCPPKTRSDLEWDRVLAALADRCASDLGKARALALPFANDHDEVRRLQAEAREATDLLFAGEPLPVLPLPDVGEAASRVAAQGVLSVPELRGLGKALEAARVLRRFLSLRRSRAPELHASCSTDPTLDRLADDLAGTFDASGGLADDASPRLRELRGEYQAAKARIVARLEDFMARYDGILQDRFVTEREGRYVVPVRSDAHERFPGIVHATSGSGSTLFVEPRSVIPMGNRLKVLEGEVEREEHAVLARLSTLVFEQLPSVLGALDALARADLRSATARLAEELRLSFPTLVDEPRMRLLEARHPLLLLETAVPGRPLDFDAVVPSDLAIAARQATVVSGPNAGGKTVALKTMGLSALMVRAGLPVPCLATSEVGIFDIVLTDVGDDQSLTKSLSTFSAHVKNLARILDDTHEGSLVLLDELAGGTDPREGEALAAGMLDSLTARGGAVVVTTHYEGLKALALADPRFANASMGFDLPSMTPTFRLALGVPGSSSALAVARKFGLPGTVIERAQTFLSREDRDFEAVVRKLNDERAALELARAAASRREEEAAQLSARLEGELRAARDRETQKLTKEAEQLLTAVRRAREELREVQSRLRSKKLDVGQAKEAERLLDRVAGQVALGGPLEPLLARDRGVPEAAPLASSSELRKGQKVHVARLRTDAEVIEVLQDGTVRVQAGPMKLTLKASELRVVSNPARGEEPRRKGAPSAGDMKSADPVGLEVAVQTSDNTCDLRGLRADDAVSLAISFLDRALNDGLRVCFLIHGHGTGSLREAIRKEVQASPYVRFFRPGSQNEGGDGVTLVWLA